MLVSTGYVRQKTQGRVRELMHSIATAELGAAAKSSKPLERELEVFHALRYFLRAKTTREVFSTGI